jgi:tetratricopeptide (TPR) repeat protein
LSEADRALEAWAADSQPDDPDLLIVSGVKADALWALGRYEEAYELRRSTLDRMRASLGADHEETLVVLNGHGADLRARGDFAGARALDAESLDLHRRVYGDVYQTFAAANNLAVDYGLTSDYAKALELNEKNYTGRRVFYGGDDNRMVVHSLNAWARDMRHIGQYLRARETAEKAYDLFRELIDRGEIGEFHPSVLSQAKDLSVNRRKAGAFPGALELAEEVYQRYQKVFFDAPDHPDRLAAGINLGNALRAMKQTDEAVDRIERTVQHYTGALGPSHPYTHGSVLNLALVRRQQGDVPEARRLLEGALEGLVATVGSDHHFTLTCITNLATALAEQGDERGAAELGRHTLNRFQAMLGPDHPHTLVCATNLALDLRALGEEKEADELADATLKRYRRVLFDDHPDVAAAVRGDRLDFDFEPPPF